MTTRHLDEGAIQAYLDGELAAEAAGEASAHLARCAACAEALAEAEAGTALFATAFAPDDGLAVPTEVLRARLWAEVARLEDAAPAGGARVSPRVSLFEPLRRLFAFTPQRAAAFASLLAIAAFAVLFAVVQKQSGPGVKGGGEMAAAAGGPTARADATPTPTLGEPPPLAFAGEGSNTTDALVAAADRTAPEKVKATRGGTSAIASVIKARSERPDASRESAAGATAAKGRKPAAGPAGEALLPGEENYRQAIASLSKAVEVGGDSVMSPKARFEYERNIALLDSAISETRRVALRNPKDKDAVGFLLAAYQSKVDLLTTVADQAQVAALGR